MIYLSLHCHHQNDSCRISEMGSDESRFNVSYCNCAGHSPALTFEDNGEPERPDSNRGT